MATIITTRNQVRWTCPVTGRRRYRSFATPAGTKAFAAKVEREALLIREDYIEPDDVERADRRSVPIEDLLADFGKVFDRRKGSKGHRASINRALRVFVREMRVTSPRDLDAHLVDRYLQGILDDGKSASTFNHYRAALRQFCQWLTDFRYLDRNPVTVVRSLDHLKDRRRISRALSVGECDRLVSATICPTRQAVHLFRIRTGIRCREASRLQWGDVDLSEGTVHLRAEVTKNGRADVLPLTGDVCGLLAELQRDALKDGRPLQPHDPLFGPPPDRRTWQRDLKRAGIEWKADDGQADPKCLRPTFNSHLERSGCDLTLAMLLMRHTPTGGMKLSVGVYGDEGALLDRKRQAVRQLERWVAGERENSKRKEA